MWFKNIQIFQLVDTFPLTAEKLHEKLMKKRARPCGKTENFTLGWVNPYDPENDALVHSCEKNLLITLNRQERLLPASVIRETLNKRVLEIEEKEARRVYGKEKQRLRDEITFELLPQAFTKDQQTHAYIDLSAQWIIINTPSRGKAELLTTVLRECLGTLRLSPIETKKEASDEISQWLLDDKPPLNFTIEDSCLMRDPNHQAGIIKCQHQDLYSKEVTAHLKQGKTIEEIALTFNDRLSFVLTSHFTLKRIRCLDLITNDSPDANEDKIEKAMTDTLIMTKEYSMLLNALAKLFGGIKSPANSTEKTLECAD
jgi:recombination associated protein RdgC